MTNQANIFKANFTNIFFKFFAKLYSLIKNNFITHEIDEILKENEFFKLQTV